MANTSVKSTVLFAVAIAVASSLSAAEQPGTGFSVDFSNCTEFAGVGPVNLAKATALVPAGFSTLPVGTTGGLVVRATACSGVRINGGPAVATNISQIGLEVVPPDGTGDINNYTLLYVSNNLELVLAFNQAGIPAKFDPTLVYQFTYDSTGKAGELYVEVESDCLPAYFLTGTETDPVGAGQTFLANWWFKSGNAVIKQSSYFPDIAFGTPAVSLHTDRNSFIGQLIGGNTDSDFHYFPVRGVYASAHMDVTVHKK